MFVHGTVAVKFTTHVRTAAAAATQWLESVAVLVVARGTVSPQTLKLVPPKWKMLHP